MIEAINRLKLRENGAREQAWIRVILSLSGFVYLLSSVDAITKTAAADSHIVFVSALYFLFALAIIAAVYLRPDTSPVRLAAGLLVDVGAITYALIAADEIGAPLYGAYLWLIIGYGYRYGRAYLYLANVLSIGGFSLVLVNSEFWRVHAGLGLGLLLWLFLLSVYVSVLLRRMDEAIDEAKEANRAKSRFLANMSHELRTPLNAIIGYSEMLREDAESQDQTQAVSDLTRIECAGRHLLEMVSEVLDFSKIEAGQMRVHMEHCALGPLVREIIATVEPLAEKNNNRLEAQIGENIGNAYVDVTKVRQILLNLLSNACKFTRDGRVLIEAGRRQDTKGEWFVAQVRDSGIGMSKAQVASLFQPFTQADSSTTRKYGGTGLGLAISKQLCELMGGAIRVDSEPGKGSSFTVTLPASRGEPEADARRTDPAVRRGETDSLALTK